MKKNTNETTAPAGAAPSASRSNDLWSSLNAALEDFQQERAPLSLFLIAWRQFYAVARLERAPRFVDALPKLDAFDAYAAALEDDEDTPGAWRAFENAAAVVALFDRREAARLTPPALSIEELKRQGVNFETIAKIYGFYDANNAPDIAAVERGDEWRPRPANVEPVEPIDAAALARLAVDALAKINDENGAAVDVETIDALRELLPADEEAQEQQARADLDADAAGAAIAREILDGVPVRQIAARYGVTVDEVRAAAAAINVTASESAQELPPRVVAKIQKLYNDGANYADIAAAVSTSSRRVTVDDVRRVMERV